MDRAFGHGMIVVHAVLARAHERRPDDGELFDAPRVHVVSAHVTGRRQHHVHVPRVAQRVTSERFEGETASVGEGGENFDENAHVRFLAHP
jgi:hypothetical protein